MENIIICWIAVDKDSSEYIYEFAPSRVDGCDWWEGSGNVNEVPSGSSEKLTGKEMSWSDNPRALNSKMNK